MQTGTNNSLKMSNLDDSSANITAEQAQALHDIANNGSAGGSDIYDYSNAPSHAQQNGIFTSLQPIGEYTC